MNYLRHQRVRWEVLLPVAALVRHLPAPARCDVVEATPGALGRQRWTVRP